MTERDLWVCPLARRRLLLGAGAAGLTALLAACGGDEPTPTGRGASTGAAPSGTGPDPGELPSGDPNLPDGALVAANDVPVSGGVVTDHAVLVVQPRAGEFRAYQAQCPHEGVLVSPPNRNGVITCPGHLSHFRVADGSRIDGPAVRGLTTVDVRVIDGYVVER